MTDTRPYTYVRHTPRGRLHELTVEEHMALAGSILADPIFCAELHSGVLRKLGSEDTDVVYVGLQSVYKFEDKIFHEGGWDQFLASKTPPAERDPLANDQHLSGVSQPVHVPGYKEAQIAQTQAALVARKAELDAMNIEWPAKIKRGLRPASKIREAEEAVRKAEQFLTEYNKKQEELELVAKTLETHPLAFIQLTAAALVREIIKITLTMPMPDRGHLYMLCHDVTKCWDVKELLELWIMEADLIVHPLEEISVLPPVKPAASLEFVHEFDPAKDGVSRTQGIDRSKEGGNRKPKPDGKKGRGRK